MLDGGVMDDRQKRVFNILENRGPKLAGVYHWSLYMLANDAVPGCESARISAICHCIRELMSGLPAIMTDASSPRPNPSSSSLMRKLPGLLAQHTDTDLGLDQDLVPVPRIVAKALASLVSTVSQEEGRNRDNVASLVTGNSKANHPAITQWRDAYQFFLGWTHLDRNHDQNRKLPSDEELLGKIRIVEDVIEVRGALFFENLHAIEDLLAVINNIDGGS